MSTCSYYESGHAKVYQQYRPVPPDELIKRVVDFLKEKYSGPLNLAVDLGCGNGQCTFKLRNYFTSVLGTDLSPDQIKEATDSCADFKCENVKFQVFPADKIPVADGSVQLVTICQAAQCLDMSKVYAEARRVLCPNGVLAIMGYHLPNYIPKQEDEAKYDEIKLILNKVLEATWDYLPKQAMCVLNEYSDITIPFSDFTREKGFAYKKTAKWADIEGCIKSYGNFKTYCEEKGHSAGKDLLNSIKSGIISILNEEAATPMTVEEAEEYEFTASFNYFLLIARV